MKAKIEKTMLLARAPNGVFRVIRAVLWRTALGKVVQKILSERIQNKLLSTLSFDRSADIFIFGPAHSWNGPLYQRPQHIASCVGSKNVYFFCTSSYYDGINILKNLQGKLFISSFYSTIKQFLISNISKFRSLTFHCYAHDPNLTYEEICTYLNAGAHVLYEYIDAIHEDLTPGAHNLRTRHESVASDERICIIATAQNLYTEIRRYRNNNVHIVTNGVEYEHFNHPREHSKTPIFSNDNPIIGYFGALASWFDYDLLIFLAQQRPDLNFLILGWDYDGTLRANLSRLTMPNVKIDGPIPYRDLPKYAQFFDVGIIPFKVNDITNTTNPIKMYEYMALGIPIVSSNLPECRRNSCVNIYTTPQEALQSIERALIQTQQSEFKRTLQQQARENSWSSKADQIVDCVLKLPVNNATT